MTDTFLKGEVIVISGVTIMLITLIAIFIMETWCVDGLPVQICYTIGLTSFIVILVIGVYYLIKGLME